MKKICCIIFIILIIISSLLIMSFFNQEEKISFKKDYTINVGENIPNIDKYIKKKFKDKIKEKIDISWKDITIEDNKIYYTGIYAGSFKYKKEKYNVKLIVNDKEKPTIEGVKDIETFINEQVDFYKNIKVVDNSKDEISKNIDGKYDLSKKGEYKLKYIIKDKSGNTTEKEFKLIVKEKPIVQAQPETANKIVPTTTSKGYIVEQENGNYYINGILIANKTYSLSSSYNPGGLTNEFMNNYNKMINDAKNEGINLRIISGFRSYQTQKTLYNNYVARDGKAAADRYSARAGHSEHQSGLAADINSLEQSWENTTEGKWLNNNCYKYGFIIRYPKGKESITGYMFEPWHIRYVGIDIATSIYNNGNWSTLEEYFGIDSKY